MGQNLNFMLYGLFAINGLGGIYIVYLYNLCIMLLVKQVMWYACRQSLGKQLVDAIHLVVETNVWSGTQEAIWNNLFSNSRRHTRKCNINSCRDDRLIQMKRYKYSAARTFGSLPGDCDDRNLDHFVHFVSEHSGNPRSKWRREKFSVHPRIGIFWWKVAI